MFALLYLPQHVILGSGYVRKSSVIQSGTLLISKKKRKREDTFSSQQNGLDTATLLVLLPSPVQRLSSTPALTEHACTKKRAIGVRVKDLFCEATLIRRGQREETPSARVIHGSM
jgi:hypothetical protein